METEIVITLVLLTLVSIYTALVGRSLSTYSRVKLDTILNRRVPADRREEAAAKLNRTLDIDEPLMLSAYGVCAISHLLLAGIAAHAAGGPANPHFWIGVGLFVLFGEILPKMMATAFAEGLIWHFGGLFRVTHWPFLWLGYLILAGSRFVRRGMGRDVPETEEEALEDRLRSIVSEGESEGVLEEETQEIIESVLEFDDKRVAEIMTPRTDLFFLEANTPLDEAVRLAHESGHSRIPVYEDTRDNVVGLFYTKDLLKFWNADARDGTTLRDVLREVTYVPETSKVKDLLIEMRRGRRHLAVVTDEYGGTAGVVTVEDALEEIVGEIHDEYDTSVAVPSIQRIDAHTLESDARVRLDEIVEEIGIELPEEDDVVTLGGFITSQLGHIPKPGESFRYEDLEVRVLEADERRVLRARLARHPDSSRQAS